MSVIWTSPLALAGLALIALPIAVHLLARHQVRTLQFPSLRFLRETQLAAFRRRSIQDPALLTCRVAIIAAAAAALAGPVVETAARVAGYADRVSRAVVISESLPAERLTLITDGAFRSTTIERRVLADGVADALRWLDAQPRSAREIVIAGALRRGAIGTGVLAMVPPDVGIRFEQAIADGPAELAVSILERRNGALTRVERIATLTAAGTEVNQGTASAVREDLVTIRSAPRDTALAEAALRAALGAGVPWRDFERPRAILWEGAGESGLGNAQVIRMPVPSPPSAAADAVHAVLVEAGRPGWVEPIAIAPQQLQSWSRPPGPPASSAPIADEGDRRWPWGAALILLAIEWWLRRGRTNAAPVEQSPGVRVA
jgi:Aerotolerance regulator N-terminal